MVEFNPENPPPVGGNKTHGSTNPPPHKQAPFQGGGSWKNYEQWMGKKNFKEFQRNICMGIARQIGKDQKRAKEAADKLKKAETGQE